VADVERSGILENLKRRSVFRVGAMYVVAAWVLLQVADVLADPLSFPDWIQTTLIGLLAIGLPVTLVLAWIFDVTPDGVIRSTEDSRLELVRLRRGHKIDYAIIGTLVIALALAYFREPEQIVSELTAEIPPSIAVLPFANMSNDPDQEYFSDGITEDILNALVRSTRMQVIARTSSFQFKGKNQDIREIGAKLNVTHVLEGSVRKAGNRIRVTAQLNSTADGAHLWSDQYDRELTELTDVFEIQDAVTQEILKALQLKLLDSDIIRAKHRNTRSIAAWNEVILGRKQYYMSTYAALEAAAQHFQKAIELDPNYADAYAALTGTYIRMVKWGMRQRQGSAELIKPLVQKALALDDHLAEAHLNAGFVRYIEGDYAGAEERYLHALALSKADVQALTTYGEFLLYQDRPAESLQIFKRGLESDPLSIDLIVDIVNASDTLGRYEDGTLWSQHLIELAPDNIRSYETAGYHYIKLGKLDRAYESFLKCARLDARDPDFSMQLVGLSLDLGRTQDANAWAEKAMAQNPDHIASIFVRTLMAYYRGNDTKAAEMAVNTLEGDVSIRFHFGPVFLRIMRDAGLEQDRYAEIESRYLKVFPLLADDTPLIGDSVSWIPPTVIATAVVDLAFVMKKAGNQQRLNRLIRKVETFINDKTSIHATILDVELLVLQDQKEAAIMKLKQAIDEGWREGWWWRTEGNKNLALLHNDPAYKAMIAELKTDMTEQAARVSWIEND
jgi:TolB-like protein/Tfp pilus assembly protein PilF